MDTLDISYVLLFALGAAHGVNPAMGWLFAVSLGLQEQRRGAVWSALGPLALGHALAIGAVVLLAAGLGLVLPLDRLKWFAAFGLAAFGVFHLTRHRHPRWGGMRIGARDLTIWSFLMASAHGAGLMVLPFVLGALDAGAGSHAVDAHAGHVGHIGQAASAGLGLGQSVGLAATLVHSAAYLIVTGLIAVVVYEKLGLRLLRRAWINLDLIWAGALIATALLTVAM
jgi:hypothetical protein